MEISKLFGLPAHPLIVHLPVVLLPIAAIGGSVGCLGVPGGPLGGRVGVEQGPGHRRGGEGGEEGG